MEQTKTIKDLTVVELKALAYDEIIRLEQAQNNIKVINQELVTRSQPPVANEEQTEVVSPIQKEDLEDGATEEVK